MKRRFSLGHLAQKIEPSSNWADLHLPGLQLQRLRNLALEVKQRLRAFNGGEFSRKSSGRRGILAIFTGTGGTGKPVAAEVLAQELRLELYRVDLNAVLSEYIGETEKNLERVFGLAATGGVVLFFDEADALFGKRSEAKRSYDRYTNAAIDCFFQRAATCRGLVILAAKRSSVWPRAVLRRIVFTLEFPRSR